MPCSAVWSLLRNSSIQHIQHKSFNRLSPTMAPSLQHTANLHEGGANERTDPQQRGARFTRYKRRGCIDSLAMNSSTTCLALRFSSRLWISLKKSVIQGAFWEQAGGSGQRQSCKWCKLCTAPVAAFNSAEGVRRSKALYLKGSEVWLQGPGLPQLISCTAA